MGTNFQAEVEWRHKLRLIDKINANIDSAIKDEKVDIEHAFEFIIQHFSLHHFTTKEEIETAFARAISPMRYTEK